MPKYTFENVSMEGPNVTMQDAFIAWLTQQELDIEGEEGVPDNADDLLWERVRRLRDSLLVNSDWMMLEDAPADKKSAKDYRKALRDLPQDFTDPREIVLPEPPS